MGDLFLEGEFVDGVAVVLGDRQLRLTHRCLIQDLGGDADTSLDDLLGLAIVGAFIRERRSKTIGTRKVEPLGSGASVWVFGHGHRLRGATWYDEDHDVVWLLASGQHESGTADDFYPFCKELDDRDELLPSEADYERLFRERDSQFAARILIEAPLLLKRAREAPGEEIRERVGGRFGTGIAIEVADDLESISVAFDTRALEIYTYIPAVLGAIAPGIDWDDANQMLSRDLEDYEVGFTSVGLVR